jgi:hypothetical protein
MALRYSVEEADLTLAAPVIQDLWARNLDGHGEQSARNKLSRGYVDNPAGSGMVMLLKVEGIADAQGAQGLHPRKFHLGPRTITAIGLADYVVNPPHRTLGPALMLLRHANQVGAGRFDLVYGLPNAKAAPVFSRAGLPRLGLVGRYVKLLGTRERLKQYLPGPLAVVAGPIIDGALAARDRARFSGPRLHCEGIGWDDPVFDTLWNHRPAGLLLAERSGAMLRWRFPLFAPDTWRVCVARDDAGAARGYVVWRLARGLVATVGDFFTIDPVGMTMPLVLGFARYARQSGAQTVSVEFFGSPAVADQLLRAGMVLRTGQTPVFAGPANTPEFGSPEIWYLTNFDDDAD